MPDASLLVLVVIIVLAVGFGVVNGFNDAANAIAASVGSRALSPRKALLIAIVANLIGAATGLEVAKTIGKGILIPEAITYLTVIAALGSVIVWGSIATWMGLPVSITHGFLAGLASAGVAVVGLDAVVWNLMARVGSSVAIAPMLGFAGGLVMMVAIFWIFRRSAPSMMRSVFSRLQWLTTAFLAYSHGKNDGQMPIGVIAMGLVAYYARVGQLDRSAAVWGEIAIGGGLWWVIVLAALAISSGTAVGGWRVIRTMGVSMTALDPVHGFAAQASAATVIEVASHYGIPVSTTHCATSAVLGVGATRRLSAVRWGVAGNIVTAWVLTFPICAALGYVFAQLLMAVTG
ncbi:MAG: inorganic phosphate transporter [Dehalococcoidales bacterium]